jgi:hypothetical protein
VPLPNGPQAQDKAYPAAGRTRLIRVRHNAGIKKGRRFKRKLVQEIRSHQPLLRQADGTPSIENVLHVFRAPFACSNQIAVAPIKAVEHIFQDLGSVLGVKRQDPLHNPIRSASIGQVKVARLHSHPKRSHNNARWVRAQMQHRAVQKG